MTWRARFIIATVLAGPLSYSFVRFHELASNIFYVFLLVASLFVRRRGLQLTEAGVVPAPGGAGGGLGNGAGAAVG